MSDADETGDGDRRWVIERFREAWAAPDTPAAGAQPASLRETFSRSVSGTPGRAVPSLGSVVMSVRSRPASIQKGPWVAGAVSRHPDPFAALRPKRAKETAPAAPSNANVCRRVSACAEGRFLIVIRPSAGAPRRPG